jgi:hypothetical protein
MGRVQVLIDGEIQCRDDSFKSCRGLFSSLFPRSSARMQPGVVLDHAIAHSGQLGMGRRCRDDPPDWRKAVAAMCRKRRVGKQEPLLGAALACSSTVLGVNATFWRPGGMSGQ